MKTVIVTGASGSMGSAAVRRLAGEGCAVVMACRNVEKGEHIRQEILRDVSEARLTVRHLDLSSLHSVRAFAAEMLRQEVPLDGLFNNAGVINRHYGRTADGYENTLAVNLVGPALLTLLLRPAFAADMHVVNMVSLTCRFGSIDKDLFEWDESHFRQLGTYSDSKLALLLFSVAVARHWPDVHVNVADPGVVNSNMISLGRWFDPLADVLFRPLCSRPEKGVEPALDALTATTTMHYFVGGRHKDIATRYQTHPMAEWLWKYFVNLSSSSPIQFPL